MTNNLNSLEKTLNYSFKNKSYLTKALTHSSKSKDNNERLEYLGDAVINLAVSEHLIKNFSDLDEGSLSILRAKLVSRDTLSRLASNIELESYLIMGKSLSNQENKKSSIFGNAFEAIIGAIYLDENFDKAATVVMYFLEEEIRSLTINQIKEKIKVFCEVKELNLSSEADGKNKKDAEQKAAAVLLKKIINSDE